MSPWNLSLFLALLYSLAVAGEPSCEDVEDFGACAGDSGDFCPRDIACSCKSGRPFCSCPFYKGPNGNYWYLGEKCDRLWSTLDMIVICVFPAVALAFVVAVTAQIIHFCKMKSKSKAVKEPKRKSQRKATSAHQNLAFIPEGAPRSQYPEYSVGNMIEETAAPKIQAAPWSAPRAEAPKPRRLNYYTDVPPAGRSSNYFEGRLQSQNNGYRLPEQDYQGYEQQVQQPQYSRISRAQLPPADYQPRAPEPASPVASRPFSFGRPQVRASYDYYDS